MEMYGERLRLRRMARGMSQQCLGQLVGCTGHTISDYERKGSKPNTRVGNKLDKILGEF